MKEIPDVKNLSKDEIIKIYSDALKERDKMIDELKKENEILLKLSLKRAKKSDHI